MKFVTLILTFLVFGNMFESAQSKTFKWDIGLCGYEGTYDSTKYTGAQLKDTVKLVQYSPEFDIWFDATPRTYEDIKKLNIKELEKEYLEKSSTLKSLDLIPSKYWEKQRQRKLKELEQVYQLSKTTMFAYETPAVLSEYKLAASCVEKYADPLISDGDRLLKVWSEVNEASRKQNSDPNRLKRIFDAQYNSPDKYKYARIEVMTFGWWNCANSTIDRVEANDEPLKNFKKLFKNVKEECDEP